MYIYIGEVTHSSKEHRIKKVLLFILIFFASCSGYKFRDAHNPLAQYNIHSITVPMFQNRSTISEVSPLFTREIVKELSKFPGLKTYSGDWKDTDAVLLGIISSPQYWRKTLGTSSTILIKREEGYGTSINKRRAFKVPRSTSIGLTLTLIIIKRPTQKEIDFIMSTEDKIIFKNPKILFTQTYSLSGNFTRDVSAGNGNDSGGVVNYTKNRGTQLNTLSGMAEQAALAFRETGLYVF
jgi:hypothetical protein